MFFLLLLLGALVIAVIAFVAVVLARRKQQQQQAERQDGGNVDGGIPHLIHQTWKTHDVPARFADGVNSWKTKNPGFEYKLYDDEESRAFVKTRYPEFLALYDELPSNVQRADVFRYLIIHDRGGVYADMDTRCLEPIAEALEGATFVAGEESNQYQFQLLQWFFAAKPRVDALLDVVREIERRVRPDARPAMLRDPRYQASNQKEIAECLYKTGPWVFTDVLGDAIKDGTVKVFPACSFGCSTRPAEGVKLYVKHDYAGTWK